MDKTEIKEELRATLEGIDKQIAAIVEDLEDRHKKSSWSADIPWTNDRAYLWKDASDRYVLVDLLLARANLVVALSNVEWRN